MPSLPTSFQNKQLTLLKGANNETENFNPNNFKPDDDPLSIRRRGEWHTQREGKVQVCKKIQCGL
jgi:hypothetical protein